MQRNWKNLIRPKAMEVSELTDTYGKFTVEPLERGYGTTLGNSLRRVLLSSIRGAGHYRRPYGCPGSRGS